MTLIEFAHEHFVGLCIMTVILSFFVAITIETVAKVWSIRKQSEAPRARDPQ